MRRRARVVVAGEQRRGRVSDTAEHQRGAAEDDGDGGGGAAVDGIPPPVLLVLVFIDYPSEQELAAALPVRPAARLRRHHPRLRHRRAQCLVHRRMRHRERLAWR